MCDRFSEALARLGVQMYYWPELELTQRWKNPFRLLSHLGRSWTVSSRLGQLARQVGADVICVNGENLLLAPRAGRIARRPVSVIIRGLRFAELGAIGRLYFAIQRRWVRQYVAVSQTARDGLMDVGVPSDRVRVVCNGVDTSIFDDGPPKPGQAESLGIPQGNRVVGSVGHLEQVKGTHHLIESFCQLAGRMSDVTCLLVGDGDHTGGPYLNSLHAKVAANGLDRRVCFAGYRDDTADLLRLMMVVVHPSESENCPRAVIEAQACGRPVVGFRVGGMPEVVEDGRTGILVRPFDTTALASAIERLLNDEPLRLRMGQAGRERVCKQYDLKRNIAVTIDLLEQSAQTTSP
jgi:glycosyltransferase involved in cell wall biosynthesis